MDHAELRRSALALLRRMELDADRADAQEEHVIVVCDPRTHREHAIGVYANLDAALDGLVRERENYLKADPDFKDLSYRAIPLFRGLHETEV